jgi:hypothetical protein
MQRQQIVLMTADTFCNSTRLDVKFLLTNAATFCCFIWSPHQGSGWMTAATFCNSIKSPHQTLNLSLSEAATFYNPTLGVC